MTEGKFERVTFSDRSLYGPPKFVVCGFSEAAQAKFKSVLAFADLTSLPLVWANQEQLAMALTEILKMPDGAGQGVSSELPRAIIVSGIPEKKLYQLMTTCRHSGMQSALWAVLTPISETWTLETLLSHLKAEREAMQRTRA